MDKYTSADRLRFIELIAFWEGGINSRDLIRQFGISRQQAGIDIANYKKQTPANLQYNPSCKQFVITPDFRRVFINEQPGDYLNWLESGQFHRQGPANNSSCITLSLPQRTVSPGVMRNLVMSIRQQRRIDIGYISLSNPDEQGRIIAPHHFVRTGLRWHLRAWCEKSRQYRDFVLSRFRGTPELLDKTIHHSEQDIGWNTEVTLILQPDPRLAPSQRRVLEQDYHMQNGLLHITTRGCLVNYLLQEMQISTKTLDATPEAQQLVLVNRSDIKPWLFE